MDPISNTDRLVLLLRQRLAQQKLSRPVGRSPAPAPARGGSLEAVRAVARTGARDDRQLKRALVQTILSDQFGQDMVNEARFQQLVARVSDALAADPDSARLLDGALDELRAG